MNRHRTQIRNWNGVRSANKQVQSAPRKAGEVTTRVATKEDVLRFFPSTTAKEAKNGN